MHMPTNEIGDDPVVIADRRMTLAFGASFLGMFALWWEFASRDWTVLLVLCGTFLVARICATIACRWAPDIALWLIAFLVAAPLILFAALQLTHGHPIVTVHHAST